MAFKTDHIPAYLKVFFNLSDEDEKKQYAEKLAKNMHEYIVSPDKDTNPLIVPYGEDYWNKIMQTFTTLFEFLPTENIGRYFLKSSEELIKHLNTLIYFKFQFNFLEASQKIFTTFQNKEFEILQCKLICAYYPVFFSNMLRTHFHFNNENYDLNFDFIIGKILFTMSKNNQFGDLKEDLVQMLKNLIKACDEEEAKSTFTEKTRKNIDTLLDKLNEENIILTPDEDFKYNDSHNTFMVNHNAYYQTLEEQYEVRIIEIDNFLQLSRTLPRTIMQVNSNFIGETYFINIIESLSSFNINAYDFYEKIKANLNTTKKYEFKFELHQKYAHMEEMQKTAGILGDQKRYEDLLLITKESLDFYEKNKDKEMSGILSQTLSNTIIDLIYRWKNIPDREIEKALDYDKDIKQFHEKLDELRKEFNSTKVNQAYILSLKLLLSDYTSPNTMERLENYNRLFIEFSEYLRSHNFDENIELDESGEGRNLNEFLIHRFLFSVQNVINNNIIFIKADVGYKDEEAVKRVLKDILDIKKSFVIQDVDLIKVSRQIVENGYGQSTELEGEFKEYFYLQIEKIDKKFLQRTEVFEEEPEEIALDQTLVELPSDTLDIEDLPVDMIPDAVDIIEDQSFWEDTDENKD